MNLSTFTSWVYTSKTGIWNFNTVCASLLYINTFFFYKRICREREQRDERGSGRKSHEFGANGVKRERRRDRERDIEFVNISWLKSSDWLLIRKAKEGMSCDILVYTNIRL